MTVSYLLTYFQCTLNVLFRIVSYSYSDGDDDDDDGYERALYLHRETDSEVSVDGDKQHCPDSHRLCYGSQRPGVRLQIRVDSVEPRTTTTTAVTRVGLVVDSLERLDEDASGQEGGVDDRQRLKQPVGGALLTAAKISTKHGH